MNQMYPVGDPIGSYVHEKSERASERVFVCLFAGAYRPCLRPAVPSNKQLRYGTRTSSMLASQPAGALHITEKEPTYMLLDREG